MSLYALGALHIGTLPFLTFFEPTEDFTTWIEQQTKQIIDCGAGVGLLSSLYPDKIMGIDLIDREEYLGKVFTGMDATTFPYHSDLIALIARPDGSGWFHDAALEALSYGTEVVYVGLEKNYERDLTAFNHKLLIDNAGKEGEQAWQILNAV